MIKVAIIGRPNVGKSTLFNKIARRNLAIVHDTSGTTRDVKEFLVEFDDGFSFILLDTAGLEKSKPETIEARMTDKTLNAIKVADLILFMVDVRTGLLPEDIYFANIVKKHNKKVILVANKSENKNNFINNSGDFYKLGFGEASPISAEHSQGLLQLLSQITNSALKIQNNTSDSDSVSHELNDDELEDILELEEDNSAPQEDEDLSVRLAIIGRPNVGKSTLVNTLLGEERMLTGDEVGITRDSIDSNFTYKGREVKIIDTAGLRKKNKVYDELEFLATSRSIESIKKSDVCAIIIDATLSLDKQDLSIANVAINEGKGLIIALNKWDLIKDKKAKLEEVHDRLEVSFSQVKNIPLVGISATKAKGINDFMKEVFEVYDLRRERVTTGKLNKWLEFVVAKNPPPLSRLKRPMSIKYITQSATRPPTFTLFVGGASIIPQNYKRYLINSLGETFGFDKIVIRLKLKSSSNPYKEKR